MSPSATRARATHQRQRSILRAALECFDQKSVIGTTMEDIRVRAGVSVGSLYHHFSNKEAIAAALYVSLIDEYQESAQAALAKTRSPKGRIKATIKHHIEWALADPARTRFLLMQPEPEVQKMASDEVRTLNQRLEERLQQWLDVEAERGSIRRMSRDIYMAQVIGPAQFYVRTWMSGSSTSHPDKAVASLSEAAWRAVRAERRSDTSPR